VRPDLGHTPSSASSLAKRHSGYGPSAQTLGLHPTMASHLRITSVPAGEAPLWVREQWVGLVLPLAQQKSTPLTFLTSGVVSGPRTFLSFLLALFSGKLERRSGFRVETQAAVAVLETRSPEAAAWWRETVPHQLQPKRYFVFESEAGNVIETSAKA
jgi:hypothetical protein